MTKKLKYSNLRLRAFTLVELIVVITILAILGTIAFISLQGYSASSRDSVRISDVSNMKTSLELFHLDAGKYPLPDNSEEITYGGDILWYQGILGQTVVSQLSRNLNEIPTDPLTDKKYIFSTSGNRNEFQILNLLESDLALNTINQTNAAISIRTPRVDGQYNGVFIKTPNYIFPTPSLLTSEPIVPTVGLLLNDTNIKSQIITGGKNIPNTGNINSSTGKLNIKLSVYSGATITSLSTDSDKKLAMQAIQGAYSGSELATSDIYALILNTAEINLPKLVDTVVLNSNRTVTTTTTNYACNDTTKPIDNGNNISFIIGTPTSENQVYIKDSSNCGYSCINGYAGTSCEIEQITGWRLLDPNCDIDDKIIGSQTWAGCNSTLGTGLEYDVNQNCYNYLGGITTGCNRPSNEKENVYNPTYGINNIWGKLYTWDSLDTDNDIDIDINDTNKVCGTGYHIPSDVEWEILETTLNGGINCRNTTNSWLCDGLGWLGHTSKNSTNNMINALQLPLSGYISNTGSPNSRGYNSALWSTTPNTINAYYRDMYRNYSTVYRGPTNQLYAVSVRCLKD